MTDRAPGIRTAHYHVDGQWTGEAVCRAGHTLLLPDPAISAWQDEHIGCEPARGAWSEIEAPLIAQGEADAELLRQRLATDEAVALAAAQETGGNGWYATEDGLFAQAGSGHAIVVDGYGFLPAEVGNHLAAHDPARVLDQCASIRDALTELERITGRSSDPDSRAWARAAINSLRRIWKPDEDEGDDD